MKYFLNSFLIEEHVKNALKEDIGFWDITSSIFDDKAYTKATLNSRSVGILCGIECVKAVYNILDKDVKINFLLKDGDTLEKNTNIATIEGKTRSVLTGERVALNYIQRLSAIATLANKYQKAVLPYKAKVVDTRKTTPNFRVFEKYAVITGGAHIHRFNLSDCVMLKDNHIAYFGSIKTAVQKVRENISHAHKIEIEVENFEQIKEALEAKADIIMLDNMSKEDMAKAVEMINSAAIVEASGNITLDNINEVAKTGVDIISTSAIQTKAGTLDIGLDIL